MNQILHMSYMTGDIFGITAALALDSNAEVIFAHGDPGEKEYDQNWRFYEACGLTDRVKKFDIRAADRNAAPKPFYADFQGAKSSPAVKKLLSSYPNVQPVHEVTRIVADKYSEGFAEAAAKVADTWKLNAAPPESLDGLRQYASRFVEEQDGECIVLWSRKSGRNGGAHVELDSSFEGIRQLADNLNSNMSNAKILLAGDDREIQNMREDAGNTLEKTKLQQIAASRPRVAAMGSFWKTDDYLRIWGNDKTMQRVGQILLWRYLDEKLDRRLVHVGMRSGNLETFAMLGMKVVYLENQGNVTGERMLQFEEVGSIPYQRFLIERPLTKTGQINVGGQAPSMIKVEESIASEYKQAVDEFYKNLKSQLSEGKSPQEKKAIERDFAERYKLKEIRNSGFRMYKPNKVSVPGGSGTKAEIPEPLRRKMFDEVLARAKKDHPRGFTGGDLQELTSLIAQRLNGASQTTP